MNPIALSQLRDIATDLRAIIGDDDQTFIDTLEGETDAIEMANALVRERTEALAMRDAMKAVAATYAERAARFDRVASGCTKSLGDLLDAAGVKKLPLPLGTVSRTAARTKVEIKDERSIPTQLCNRVPDTAAIKAQLDAGEAVPGAALVLGQPGLSIRIR